MTVKLDNKDKRIMLELQRNARQATSSIAKKTRLPRDVVVYRIKKLEENKVIRGYRAMIDPKVLGFKLYVYVGFSLFNINPGQEKLFVAYLTEHNNITYVAKNSGKWDFSVGICAQEYLEFDTVLRDIRKKFATIIKEFDVAPVIEDYKYDQIAQLL